MQLSPKQQFIDAYNRESVTTARVLRAFPVNHAELRPHAMCKTARELAWIFVQEQGMCHVALTNGFDWSKPPGPHPAPASFDEIVDMFEKGREQLTTLVADKEDHLPGTVKFPVAPKTLGDITTEQFLWMTLCDQIHHRGQFSIYLRMAGGKVPSIYGPTADEPWM
jgi:uncharacterized damage-inducible protein DinB